MGSPAQAEAAAQVLQIEAQEKRIEDQRFKDRNYKFDYMPKYHGWCSWFTCDETELRVIKKGVMSNNYSAAVNAREHGRDFFMDPETGVVRPIYGICLHINADSSCKYHQSNI